MLPHLDLELETRPHGWELQRQHGETLELGPAGGQVVEGEGDLEQGMATELSIRSEVLDQLVERQLRMGEGVESGRAT